MRVSDPGKPIGIELYKRQSDSLTKAADLLERIADFPCEQAEKARETARSIRELNAAMTKPEPPQKAPKPEE